MKSKVYFSSTQARGYHENKISKIKKLYKDRKSTRLNSSHNGHTLRSRMAGYG